MCVCENKICVLKFDSFKEPDAEPLTLKNVSSKPHSANRLLESIGSLVANTADVSLRGTATAYLYFLHAKEKTGLERAQLSNVFGTDAFGNGQLAMVAGLPKSRAATEPVACIVATVEAGSLDDGFRAFYRIRHASHDLHAVLQSAESDRTRLLARRTHRPRELLPAQ